MGEYTFERVDESRYKDLVYLSQEAFGINTTIDYYRSKMNTKYLGVSHLGFLVYDQNAQPAAFYGVYPTMMEYKGKLYLAAQSGDTMTHPKHGGKGLFTTAAKMTYDLAKSEGIEFIFGFPNDNSLPGFVKKLSWLHKENMRDYKFQIRTIPLAAIAKRFSFLSALYNRYIQLVLKFYKPLKTFQPSSVINNNFGGVYRSLEFFRYKSFYDNHLILLAGRTAWIKIDGALLVGDIEINDQNNVESVIGGLERFAMFLGCNKILFSVGKDTTWDLILKGKYGCEEKTYVGYLDLKSGLPLENFKYTTADYDTF